MIFAAILLNKSAIFFLVYCVACSDSKSQKKMDGLCKNYLFACNVYIYIFFFKQNIHNTLHTGYCTGTHKGIFTEITKEIFYKGNV